MALIIFPGSRCSYSQNNINVIMASIKKVLCGLSLSALLTGCGTVYNPCCNSVQDLRPAVMSSRKLTAVGYGAVGGSNSQYTLGQQKLLAMRAARVDAYRNLAEQVYGFHISGNTSVSAFATQNDSIRTYVDAFIRGARVVSLTPVADGNYEATVELDLTPAFFYCVSNNTAFCGAPARLSDATCGVNGCVQPSAYYYSTY